jgi:hypothetical protein
VIEEYIRLGQTAASAFSAAMPGGLGSAQNANLNGFGAASSNTQGTPFGPPGAMGLPPGALPPMFDEFARTWLQMWQQWISLVPMDGMMNPPEAQRPTSGSVPPFEATQAASTTAPRAPAPAALQRVRVQLSTRQPTDCAVELRAGSGTPILHELRAPDPALPRLSDCQILREADEWVVRVHVPDGQPEAIYSGVIVDDVSSLPLGTVWVQIGGSPRPEAD